jgi:hypothetical protein
VDLPQDGFDLVGGGPIGIVEPEGPEIAGPPAMIADPVVLAQRPVQLLGRNLLA